MSNELSQLTASGGTIELGGRILLMRQLSIGDFGQIQEWLKSRVPKPFQLVAESLRDLSPMREFDPEGYEKAREKLMAAALEDSRAGTGVGASSPRVEAALNEPAGLTLMLWLCVRKDQPNVTQEWIAEQLDREDVGEIKKKLDAISFGRAGDVEDDRDIMGLPAGETAADPKAQAPRPNRQARRQKKSR